MSDDGGSAFPLRIDLYESLTFNLGMTLRDYFAAKAMLGQINNPMNINTDEAQKLIVKRAYQIADVMLKEGTK